MSVCEQTDYFCPETRAVSVCEQTDYFCPETRAVSVCEQTDFYTSHRFVEHVETKLYTELKTTTPVDLKKYIKKIATRTIIITTKMERGAEGRGRGGGEVGGKKRNIKKKEDRNYP